MARADRAVLEEEVEETPRPVVDYFQRPWMVEARRKLARRPFLVLEGGVYTGKTSFGACFGLNEMFEFAGETTWWPAPEDWHIRRFWEEFKPAADATGCLTLQTPHCFVRTPQGSTLHGVTTKNLKAIASYHPHRIIADEVSKMTIEAFNLLRVRMLKAKRVILMSNRGGPLWERIRKWGLDKRHGKWDFLMVTTEEAGIVSPEEIAMIRKDIPNWLFVQDFLCGEAEGDAKVFKAVEACARYRPEGPIKGERYVVTYDPADSGDYGFATVWRGFRAVHCERWQETGYRWQAQKVVGIAMEYNVADIVFDRRGVGVPVGEMMDEEVEAIRAELERKRDRGDGGNGRQEPIRTPFVTGVEWDNTLKMRLVNDATTMVERGQIEFVDRRHGDVYATFVDEHKAFERTRSRSGLTYTFQAPSGSHDDSVSTTLLRVHGTRQPRITVIGEEKGEAHGGNGSVRQDRQPRITRL